jgi:hypothetical protein
VGRMLAAVCMPLVVECGCDVAVGRKTMGVPRRW